MQSRQLILAAIVLMVVCGRGAGQRVLDNKEVADVLNALTNSPRDTWIASGVIQARHLEYRAAADQILESDVTVRYDGDRFYWEINIDSDNGESVSGRRAVRGAVNVQQNRNRVFVWDGSRYTLYFKPCNQAIVYEDTSRVPIAVTGPLTAGLIPWGYGAFTYEALSGSKVSAVETQRDGRTVVELTIRPSESLSMSFVLDRAKGYAALASTVRSLGRSIIVRTCEGYRLVGGRYVPETAEIEVYDDSVTPAQLRSYDRWNLTSVTTQLSAAAPFELDFAPDARIEEYTKLSQKPLVHYKSPQADTQMLRRMRTEIIAAGDAASTNCAAVTARYVLTQAGKQMTQQQTEALAPAKEGATSLHAIKSVLAAAGLRCRAVRTDIAALRKVKDCSIVLHLPNRKHFVILDHIDDHRVWLIDLDHNRFYFPMKTELFDLEWSNGTALLVSHGTAAEAQTLPEIPDTQLKKMLGADSFGTYSCNQLLQAHRVVYCMDVPEAVCGGQYREYPERWGCGLDAAGGSCQGEAYSSYIAFNCIENSQNPGQCTVDGEPINHLIRACR